MITVTLRDLQWRARRFVIAGVGAAVVFALTLVLSGVNASFESEVSRTVDATHADAWVVQQGVQGIFTVPSVVPAAAVAAVAREPGVRRADPIVVIHGTVQLSGIRDVEVFGYTPGGLGDPKVSSGRSARTSGEAVVDDSLGVPVGGHVTFAGHTFDVVGHTHGQTILAAEPLIFMSLRDAQGVLLGTKFVSAILTQGIPTELPDGLAVRTKAQTKSDAIRPIMGAISAIRLLLFLLWGVAATVVGSVVYLGALERRRDFAVFKATGWSTRSLAAGLAAEAVLISTGASIIGLGVARAIVPFFALASSIPTSAMLLLPCVGVVVGLLASAAGLRRAVGVDPAIAFGGP